MEDNVQTTALTMAVAALFNAALICRNGAGGYAKQSCDEAEALIAEFKKRNWQLATEE